MLVRRRLSKKRVILLTGTMVVVWGIIGTLVYKNFWAKNQAPSPAATVTTGPNVQDIVVPPIPPFNRDILADPGFNSLRVYGEVPLQIPALGRANPFEVVR